MSKLLAVVYNRSITTDDCGWKKILWLWHNHWVYCFHGCMIYWKFYHIEVQTKWPPFRIRHSQMLFSWMQIYELWFKFQLWFQLTIIQHRFRYWPGTDQTPSHFLNQWWLVYRRIYALLGLNMLNIVNWFYISNNVNMDWEFVDIVLQAWQTTTTAHSKSEEQDNRSYLISK